MLNVNDLGIMVEWKHEKPRMSYVKALTLLQIQANPNNVLSPF